MIDNVYKSLIAVFLLLTGSVVSVHAASLPKQGPKARVAVAQFGATDRFASVYGGWNIGGGLAAQLVTSLIESGRVVVVERAILSKVLMEQELGTAQMSSPFTQVPSGQLLGVDYLIVGEVTEFDERQMGGGGALAVMKGFGPKISGDFVAAHVGIDLRVIDTRTGEILYSHQSQGKAWEKAITTKVDYKFIDFGGDVFQKTPLGKATRRTINDALQFVLGVVEKRTKEFSWLARVIEVEGNDVYVDAGKNANVENGDRFKISAVKKILTDPETNEILGLVEIPIATAEAVEIDMKFTRARLLGPLRPNIGDIVRMETQKAAKIEGPRASLAGYEVWD